MDAPHDWTALLFIVLALGARHGFDPDHLAAIDGLTRFNALGRPRLARACGSLFSLGHGAVVVAVALGVSRLASQWQVPLWMEAAGAWLSIGVLALLGGVNVAAVLRAAPDEVVRARGLRSRWVGCLTRARHPAAVAFVGALFALSFDTLSQAALFAAVGVQFGGWAHALALGLTFTLGMLAVDGLNGLWISHLIRRADHLALIGSRVMGLAVGGVSLGVALLGLARQLSPAAAGWADGRELAIGLAVVLALALAFSIVRWRAGATVGAR